MKIEITVDEETGHTECSWTWDKLGHAGYAVAIQQTLGCSAAILAEFKDRTAQAVAAVASQPVAIPAAPNTAAVKPKKTGKRKRAH